MFYPTNNLYDGFNFLNSKPIYYYKNEILHIMLKVDFSLFTPKHEYNKSLKSKSNSNIIKVNKQFGKMNTPQYVGIDLGRKLNID